MWLFLLVPEFIADHNCQLFPVWKSFYLCVLVFFNERFIVRTLLFEDPDTDPVIKKSHSLLEKKKSWQVSVMKYISAIWSYTATITSLSSVFCTLYSVLCIVYRVICTLNSVLWTLYFALCTVYSVPPTGNIWYIILSFSGSLVSSISRTDSVCESEFLEINSNELWSIRHLHISVIWQQYLWINWLFSLIIFSIQRL